MTSAKVIAAGFWSAVVGVGVVVWRAAAPGHPLRVVVPVVMGVVLLGTVGTSLWIGALRLTRNRRLGYLCEIDEARGVRVKGATGRIDRSDIVHVEAVPLDVIHDTHRGHRSLVWQIGLRRAGTEDGAGYALIGFVLGDANGGVWRRTGCVTAETIAHGIGCPLRTGEEAVEIDLRYT